MSIAKTSLIEEIKQSVDRFNSIKLDQICQGLGIADARSFSDEDAQKIRVKAGIATSQSGSAPVQGVEGGLVKAKQDISAMVQGHAANVATMRQQIIASRERAADSAAEVLAHEMGSRAFEENLLVSLAQKLSQPQEGLDWGIADAFEGFTLDGTATPILPGHDD